MFTKNSFYYNFIQFQSNEAEVDKAVKILNTLTPEQEWAVKLYVRSQRCEEREDNQY